MIDPKALMQIKNLELRVRLIMQGFKNGLHRSPYHGFSVEFTEFRQYSPGDDPRFIDWKVYARRDSVFIRKFEDETNLRCHLIVDYSRSMGFGTVGWEKMEYARTLAATFAYFLQLQGDAVGLMTFDDKIRNFIPARNRTGHLRRIFGGLEIPPAGAGTDLIVPLRKITQFVRKRGLMVIMSDFLFPLDQLERELSTVVAARHDVIVLQILDKAEGNFQHTEEAVLVQDLETGKDLYVDPAAVRKEYIERFQAHSSNLENLCQKLGVGFFRMFTHEPLERALGEFVQQQMVRGKKIRRLSRPVAKAA